MSYEQTKRMLEWLGGGVVEGDMQTLRREENGVGGNKSDLGQEF